MNKQKATINQVVESTIENKKDRREGKGRVLVLSRNVFRLRQNTNTFYIESESSDDRYYFVKFKPDDLKWCSCSCKDNSTKHLKCKHLYAIEFAIKWGTIRDIDKLPPIKTAKPDVETEGGGAAEDTIQVVTSLPSISNSSFSSISYKDDDYTF